MQFTLTITGDAQELAALLSKVPAAASKAPAIDLSASGLIPAQSNGHTELPPVEVVPEAEAPAVVEAPAKRTRRSTPAVVVEAAPEAAAEAVAKVVEDATKNAGTTISHVPVGLDHLRKVMQTKLKHQKQIIAWLEEYGAKNLSSLDAAHYETMYSQLNSLD